MAPLNLQRDEDERTEEQWIEKNEVSDNVLADDTTTDILERVKSVEHCRLRSTGNTMNKEDKNIDSLKSVEKQTAENLPEADRKDSCSEGDSCEECEMEQKEPKCRDTRVYYKDKKDNITVDSSIRNAMFSFAPKWLKSFIKDPEYLMAETKKGDE